MAQYKVPQDVEADDKLLGPFSFRQFIYLAIAGGGIALAVALFQLFPLLAIIPLPIVFFFAILALPLKKDQPMETYIVAVLSYHLKSRKRFWVPGQRETTVEITAPKVVEKPRTRDITREEASHRLSFLAEVIDTEGKSVHNGSMNADFLAEANNAQDIFDLANTDNLNAMITKDADERRAEIINSMRDAATEPTPTTPPQITHSFANTPAQPVRTTPEPQPTFNNAANSPATVQPTSAPKPEPTPAPEPELVALATDPDLSVGTIQKEAERIKSKHKDEVFISLH